ncbi:MAG: hypothetical protein ABIM99_03165 [Candidatus Dojkabacteria bacterium]
MLDLAIDIVEISKPANIILFEPETIKLDYSDLPYENLQEVVYLFTKIDEILDNADTKSEEDAINLKTLIISILNEIEGLGIHRNEIVSTMNKKAISVWIDMNTNQIVDLDQQTD